MTKEKTECCNGKKWNNSKAGASAGVGAIYGLGFIGAVIYYIQHAATFWEAIVGLLQAFVWPAFVVYKVLEFFNM